MRAIAVVLSCALGVGCGPTLWALTPQQAPTYREVVHPTEVHVVHGAPGSALVRMPYREIRAERRKTRVATAVGMVVDIVGGAVLALLTQDTTDEPAATITVGAALLGVVIFDVHLLANRTVESERVEPVYVDESGAPRFGLAPGARPIPAPTFGIP